MPEPTYEQTFTPPVDELACAEATLTVLQKVIGPISRDDMSRPTPCTEFDVAGLTAHLMSSIAALGGAAGAQFPDNDPQEAVDRQVIMAARPALDAWHRRGLDGSVPVGPGDFPASAAVSILALEFLVHGWDYARAMDRDLEVPDTLAGYVFDKAQGIITDDGRRFAGFAQPVQISGDAPAFQQLLAFTGRRP
ncbi:MAG: hypothetical protein K0R68_275 [Mycobacterium sp.]|nr:hypothetical protein [Mycobacterium sp.]